MEEISFGEWLSRQRKSMGLTQEQLARQVNCATITLRKIEADQRRPSAQIAQAIASVFHLPATDFAEFTSFARGHTLRENPTPGDTHPWRAPDKTSPTSLPAPLSTLIGRTHEIVEISSQLRDPAIRLVTLVGPPGIGKTRLSQAVAHELGATFADGEFFIPLELVELPRLLAQTILQAVDGESRPGKTALDTLKNRIDRKIILLILDDVEHLIEAASSIVFELLQACPNLKILVTSREAMRLEGEQVYPVPALELPTEDQLPYLDAETALGFSSLKLFTTRAKAVNPGFRLNDENIRDVAAICRRLDGMPLAIELLAARSNLMSAHTLLTRLDRQLVLHTGGPRSLPPHQKSLYHAIFWSYDLLTPREKRLFTYLSVFSNGFTLEAAEQVFSDDSCEICVADMLNSLLQKSLLLSFTSLHGEPRFSMYTTIQQFAAEQLTELGEVGPAQNRHLAYYLKCAQQYSNEIGRQTPNFWGESLLVEQDNFRAALNWCLLEKRTTDSLLLLRLLGGLWQIQGNQAELSCWLSEIQNLFDLNAYPEEYAELLQFASLPYLGSMLPLNQGLASGPST